MWVLSCGQRQSSLHHDEFLRHKPEDRRKELFELRPKSRSSFNCNQCDQHGIIHSFALLLSAGSCPSSSRFALSLNSLLRILPEALSQTTMSAQRQKTRRSLYLFGIASTTTTPNKTYFKLNRKAKIPCSPPLRYFCRATWV